MRSHAQIRARVRRLLKEAGIKRPSVNVKKVARDHGLTVRPETFGELSGMLISDGQRWIIGINEAHADVRQRFTIAHELGHYFLHPEQEFHVDHSFSVRFRGPRSSAGIDEIEIEANRFAAELLMPRDFIHRDLKGREIEFEDPDEVDEVIESFAKRYRVSTQAMSIRLTNMGLGKALGILDVD